ncbi:MAG TPA: hypothetical protein VIR03_01075 [Candidatus Saccharimonadales bacterium]
MTSPNLPPSQDPAPANTYQGPVLLAEALPLPNGEITEAQWTEDLAALTSLTERLYHIETELATIRDLIPQRTGDQVRLDHLIKRERELIAERDGGRTTDGQHIPGINDRIVQVALRSNTTAFMLELKERADVAVGHREVLQGQAAEQRDTALTTRDGAVKSAATWAKRTLANARERLYGNPEAGLGKGTVSAEAREAARLGLSDAANMRIAAQDAASKHEYTAGLLRESGNYHGNLRAIANAIRQHQEAVADQIEVIEYTGNVVLENWSFDDLGRDRTVEMQAMQAQIDSFRALIDTLSPYDQLRAEALARLARMEYRYQDRLLAEQSHSQAIGQNYHYTNAIKMPDGGIRKNTADPADDYISYGDGSVARFEHEAGGFVRRDASGGEYAGEGSLVVNYDEHSLPQQTRADLEAKPTDELHRHWEGSRSLETAQAYHAKLTIELSRGYAEETQVVDEIQSYVASEAQQQALIEQIIDNAVDDQSNPRQLTPEEQGVINQARQEIGRLQRISKQQQSRLLGIRSNIARNVFWMGAVEASHHRIQETQVVKRHWLRFGEVATSQMVAAQDRAPKFNSDGSVNVYGYTPPLYGIPGPRDWRLYPDARADRYEPSQS